MAKSYSKSKGRSTKGGFILIPHAVLDSDSFKNLSGNAVIVLLHLIRSFKGNNNGDLSAPFSQAKHYGIGSQSTWYKAIAELINAGLILRTRDPVKKCAGNPHGKCALFAITWQPINDCDGKLDVESTATAPRKFSMEKFRN